MAPRARPSLQSPPETTRRRGTDLVTATSHHPLNDAVLDAPVRNLFGTRPGAARSSRHLMALQRSAGNRAVVGLLAGRAKEDQRIQRYEEVKDKDGDNWRMSESRKSALWVKQEEGGQTLFATPDLVKQANGKLAKAGQNGSFIRLAVEESGPVAGLLPELSGDAQTVVPKLVTVGPDPGNKKLAVINQGKRADDDGKKNKEFALWADCGRSSRVVMGTDAQGASPHAEYRVGGKAVATAPSTKPSNFTRAYSDAMPKFVKDKKNKKFLKEGVHYKKGMLWDSYITPTDDKDAKRLYWELGEDGRTAFDVAVGINYGANPEIGGAYTIATGSDFPGFSSGPRTWNFHWAGVVMKDGPNNVTLENYAVSYGTDPDPVKNQELQQKAYDEVNRSWVFQMYGLEYKSQTFQGQHVASGTHGNRGTTLAVKV